MNSIHLASLLSDLATLESVLKRAAETAERPRASFELSLVHSGKCLEVAGSSNSPGATVEQSTCTGAANQQWEMVPVGDGSYEVVAGHSGLLLTLESVSSSNVTTAPKPFMSFTARSWF